MDWFVMDLFDDWLLNVNWLFNIFVNWLLDVLVNWNFFISGMVMGMDVIWNMNNNVFAEKKIG